MRKLSIFLLPFFILSACSAEASESSIQTAIAQTEGAAITDTPLPSPSETPVATATSKITATPAPTKPWPVEHARVTDLRFFESGPVAPSDGERDYGFRFNCDDARYIYYELSLDHDPGPDEIEKFLIRAVYSRVGGEQVGEVETASYIRPDWEASNHYRGFGWPQRGNWDEGSYQVDIYIGDDKITSGSFQMSGEPPTPAPTNTNIPTPTQEYQSVAVVDTQSLNVREGPGTGYPIRTGVPQGEKLDIIGRAYGCDWLKIETSKGISGWVSAQLVSFDMPCEDIPSASIPPTPPPPPATSTPEPQEKPSGKTVKVRIVNDTGGTLTLSLSGPENYKFTFGPGNDSINVIAGTYNFTAWGCGGASTSGTKKLKSGYEWEFFCSG